MVQSSFVVRPEGAQSPEIKPFGFDFQ